MTTPNPRQKQRTTFDEEIGREILWEVANGMTATAAARDRGIPASTWSRWKKQIPGLADRVEAAESERWQRRLRIEADRRQRQAIINTFKRSQRCQIRREQRRAEWDATQSRFGGNLELMQTMGVKLPREARQRLRFDRFKQAKAAGVYRNADRNSPWRRGERARRTQADWLALSKPHIIRTRIDPNTGERTVIYDSHDRRDAAKFSKQIQPELTKTNCVSLR